jgi:hypothetical protein
LCLDAHDAKSYPGEPTDNKQPNDASSRFTSSNSWGTYQTNQYNSATYFSIGTISSVSGNVVTTSSNHPFRTFDAVRAQTSGGGINAGTDYFIKKLSDTTFTIHAYNSSQNGTQGYIRSDGYHQVHESIATDTRISINATSFPTMWWGAPHLPNTAHVKELRIGGGPKRGTNAMRIHVTRTVGVDGGMSYGVNVAGATQGDTVTTSWWARSSLPSKGVTYYTYWGSAAANSTGFTPTQKWQKFTHTWTASATYSFYQYWFQGADSAPWWFELADLQTEINKSYSTPYVLAATDRSTTDAWKDRSGNDYDGDFVGGVDTGVSHYRKGQVIEPKSNAYLDFDGTDDKIDIGSLGTNGEFSESTISIWFKKDAQASNYGNVYDCNYGATTWNKGPRMEVDIAGSVVRVYMSSDAGSYTSISFGNLSNDVWYNAVLTVAPNSTSQDLKTYTNGALVSSSTSSSSYVWDGDMADLYLGVGYTSGRHFTGQIAAFQIYKKVLTAAQIKANFNAQRGRYGV